ncbi:MAG: hypothetical protein QOE16_901 [Microbacteriaceae bacterium]|nr:hypothetical protein [Microbacteriaceae bacterium]
MTNETGLPGASAEDAVDIGEMRDDDWIMLRAPMRAWEWIGLPLFLLALIALVGYLGFRLAPHPTPTVGAVALIVTSVLSVAATVVVGVFGYRSYARATAASARTLFKAMDLWSLFYAADLMVFVLITGNWGYVIVAVVLGLFVRLSRGRARSQIN